MTSPAAPRVELPRVGMLATVRNRRALVASVDPFDGGERGRLHLVTVEYTDAGSPADDRLIWEREVGADLIQPTALPDPSRDAPMPRDEFDALVRATRWSAISPFVDPDRPEGALTSLPLAAPFHAAIQVEDFQLVPLLKALRMPRVSLLLADDVGLGKTIEAGLILSELLIRRRVRRVLILCPASLKDQWRQEMRDKFALGFDEVDRERTHALRKRLGMDANPWRTFTRVVTSYDYLKQPDVFEAFRAASRPPEGTPHLPWDMLIVDEAHNLTPAAFGDDSEASRMLGQIAPLFEHKLFLTATPHNGHTRSFTGLLERLDPVRFSQRDELSEAEKGRVEQVVVRRLKREINARTNPPLFGERTLAAVPIRFSPAERALSQAFAEFRRKVHTLVARGTRGEQLAGSFAVEVLGKRLLSCPVAFADSWHRYQDGLEDPEGADAREVQAAQRASAEETKDDREAEGLRAHAARTVGAWLRPLAADLEAESKGIERALRELSLGQRTLVPGDACPSNDARFTALTDWINGHLRTPNGWRDDERLIIFTEYKTTLDYLQGRLAASYGEDGAIRMLFGGMDEIERREIKAAFNDSADPVRVLVATDAASEGLNLQETARYLMHFDVPWNPARLEQRNGRLDRHGQARDVTVHHFTSDDDADVAFLAYVVGKVDKVREDLGSTGEVFDAALHRRLIKGEDDKAVRLEMEAGVDHSKGRAAFARDAAATPEDVLGEAETSAIEGQRLKALADELDLDPKSLRDTLEVALGIRMGRPRFEGPDDRGRVRLRQPIPPGWDVLVDDSLRLEGKGGHKGPLPALVFDPLHFIESKGGRAIFRPQRDTALLHLAHPLFQRALTSFAQLRFPGKESSTTRWAVRRGDVPLGADALVLLTIEELAVNELRESFHHWVRTICLPVRRGTLQDPLPHASATRLRSQAESRPGDAGRAQELWDEIAPDVRRFVTGRAEALTALLRDAVAREREHATRRERDRFQSRQGELSALIEQQSLARIEREIDALEEARKQGRLFDPEDRLQQLLRSEQAKKDELHRRRVHYEELRQQLTLERERVIEHLVPRRYALHGNAQVFPVTVEIRLPERA